MSDRTGSDDVTTPLGRRELIASMSYVVTGNHTYDLLVPCNSDYDLSRYRYTGDIECTECNGEGVIGDPDCSDLQCPICEGEGYLSTLKEDPLPEGAA